MNTGVLRRCKDVSLKRIDRALFLSIAFVLSQFTPPTHAGEVPGEPAITNILFDDFERFGEHSMWSGFGGTVLATNHGGSVSGSNSLWFGGDDQRFAATIPMDTQPGGRICFFLRLAQGTNPGTWETVDIPTEAVVVEYSTNEEAWIEIERCDSDAFFSWTPVTIEIPIEAQAPATQFRWRQWSHSGQCCDHWALDDVSITIGPQPPMITSLSTSQTVPINMTATFCAAAAGTPPLAYQWRFKGTNLLFGTNDTLTIARARTNDSGGYSVLVTNSFGSTSSSHVTLTVIPPGTTFLYLRSACSAPWQSTANEAAMDKVFGQTNWLDLRYQTADTNSLFSPSTGFIFMEGSDYTATALESFLDANLPTIQNWVAAGGRLFINAAPNEDDGMDFGFAVTLAYPNWITEGFAAVPSHPIFTGPYRPAGTSWTGNWFAHASLAGTNLTSLITNTAGQAILGEKNVDAGHVLFGCVTTPEFQSPRAEAANLRANLLAYASDTKPEITLQPLVIRAGGTFDLWIRRTDGRAMIPADAARTIVLSSTNLTAPLDFWHPLADSTVLSNGNLCVPSLNISNGSRFFRVMQAP
jgi:hypothetical protein